MSKLKGQSTSCPNSIAQQAAIEALTGDQSSVSHMRTAFKTRRNLIIDKLLEIEGVTCEMPKGAFYVFPDFSHYLNSFTPGNTKIESVTDLCMYILDSTGVVTVAGDSFGAPGYIRLSIGIEHIDDILADLEQALEQV